MGSVRFWRGEAGVSGEAARWEFAGGQARGVREQMGVDRLGEGILGGDGEERADQAGEGEFLGETVGRRRRRRLFTSSGWLSRNICPAFGII